MTVRRAAPCPRRSRRRRSPCAAQFRPGPRPGTARAAGWERATQRSAQRARRSLYLLAADVAPFAAGAAVLNRADIAGGIPVAGAEHRLSGHGIAALARGENLGRLVGQLLE